MPDVWVRSWWRVMGCQDAGRLGMYFVTGILTLNLPRYLEKQNAGGGELLGERGDAEFGDGGVGDIPFFVGESVASFKGDFAMDANEDGAAEGSVG